MKDAIAQYFEEVGRLKLPTKEEERAGFIRYGDLTARIKNTTDPTERGRLTRERARLGQQLASGYLRFVIKKAHGRTRDKELLLDLISAGNEGLMLAVAKFNTAYSNRFLTYADYWIKVKQDEFLHRLGTVHISVHVRKQAFQEGEVPVDPILTPIDDVILSSDVDVEKDAEQDGKRALHYLRKASLTRRERLLLVFLLGLRGSPHTEESVALLFFAMDGSVFLVEELKTMKAVALGKVRSWLDANPSINAREELCG